MEGKYTPAIMQRDDPGYLRFDRFRPPTHDIPNWLDERLKDTPAYYPHALIAYPHWVGLKHPPFPADGYLFGDCGGFTIQTRGDVIDPLDVIRWQLRTKCSVGPLLDNPPSDATGSRFFEEALEKTVRYTKRALPVYEEDQEEGGTFRWWGVVHGWTGDDMTRWYDAIRKVYPFDGDGEGWCFKPRPNINPRTVARCLNFIRKRDKIRRVHFLMTTGARDVATLLALGEEAGLDFISYDSSTFTAQAIMRAINVVTSDGLAFTKRAERGNEHGVRDFLSTECPCLSCQALRSDQKQWKGFALVDEPWNGYWVFRFAYHNLLASIRLFQNIAREVEMAPVATLKAMLGSEYPAVMRAFEGRETFTETRARAGGILDHI